MFMGLIFDTVGRKLPTVVGFLVAGTSILGTPWFTEVYPWFLIMRVMISVGIIPGLNNPLLPDYVQQGSLGLANAYVRSAFYSLWV
jgi:MFS family permease